MIPDSSTRSTKTFDSSTLARKAGEPEERSRRTSATATRQRTTRSYFCAAPDDQTPSAAGNTVTVSIDLESVTLDAIEPRGTHATKTVADCASLGWCIGRVPS